MSTLTKEAKRYIPFHKYINAIKDVPCVDCGKQYPACAMDFDHVRGEKVSGISQMQNWPHFKLKEEIAKCEVVCSNCHRIRTHLTRCDRSYLSPEPDPQLDLFTPDLRLVESD